MDDAQIKQAIPDMVAMNAALCLEAVASHVALLIDRLETGSETYEKDMAILLQLGATIQKLQAGENVWDVEKIAAVGS